MQHEISFANTTENIPLGSLVRNRSNPTLRIWDRDPVPGEFINGPLSNRNASWYFACVRKSHGDIKLRQIAHLDRDAAKTTVIHVRASHSTVKTLKQPSNVFRQLVRKAAKEPDERTDTLSGFIRAAIEERDGLHLVTGITSVKGVVFNEYSVTFTATDMGGSIPISEIIQMSTGATVPGIDPGFSVKHIAGVANARQSSFEDERIFLVHYQKVKIELMRRVFNRYRGEGILELDLGNELAVTRPIMMGGEPRHDEDEWVCTFAVDDSEEQDVVGIEVNAND
ncbi:hypothetical protein QFC19_003416 [Naganishia cerealis]|uniref:Uncharacterized protein n=1 Tax=Naganishia cerealis TaxID=610337 RepID=A0ACC2W387_9TREE|nr:hypothetical protein QFC19_003416 [Naganishia cerealis]